MTKKLISIITPTFNEVQNIEALHDYVCELMQELPDCEYEHIIIDNNSTDGTDLVLQRMAQKDKTVKVIFNTRNFGHLRSPYHALMQGKGDALVVLGADFQDPPELIIDFVKQWLKGYKLVLGVKKKSAEGWLQFKMRCLYYQVLHKMAETPVIDNFMGFGLYDRCVVEALRKMDDPYPYIRGLIAETGYQYTTVEYYRPLRKNGKSHNNIYTLIDIAMLGLTNNTKVPLRLATVCGFGISCLSFIIGLFYLVYKLINWDGFEIGLAPVIVGMAFLGGIQLMFLGIIGEYVGQIYTQVLHRPLVVEKERINFKEN